MIDIIDILLLIPGSLFTWFVFLLHEWGHIKSQGFWSEGTINVYKTTMTASANDVHNSFLHRLGGGLISGTIFTTMGILLALTGGELVWWLYVPMITGGVINLAYGVYEGYNGSEGRYKVYIATLILMAIFWIWLLL